MAADLAGQGCFTLRARATDTCAYLLSLRSCPSPHSKTSEDLLRDFTDVSVPAFPRIKRPYLTSANFVDNRA
jgi:hypothetical protein